MSIASSIEDAQGKNFKYIGPELENIKYFGPGVGVGLRKNEPELLDKVNNALKGMFADGTFKVNHFNLGDFDLFITAAGQKGRLNVYTAVVNRVTVSE